MRNPKYTLFKKEYREEILSTRSCTRSAACEGLLDPEVAEPIPPPTEYQKEYGERLSHAITASAFCT